MATASEPESSRQHSARSSISSQDIPISSRSAVEPVDPSRSSQLTARLRSCSSNGGRQQRFHAQRPSSTVSAPAEPDQETIRRQEIRKEREARSIAIERAYVHDVYEQISQHISDSRYRAWPRVKQFLQELEPGSLVCDVGKNSTRK